MASDLHSACRRDGRRVGAVAATGDLKPEQGMARLHTVSVTLDDAVADREEMHQILRDALAHYDLGFADDQGRTVLALTVEAADLWLAVLTVMNAVSATGYAPIAVTARSTRRPQADRGG